MVGKYRRSLSNIRGFFRRVGSKSTPVEEKALHLLNAFPKKQPFNLRRFVKDALRGKINFEICAADLRWGTDRQGKWDLTLVKIHLEPYGLNGHSFKKLIEDNPDVFRRVFRIKN